MFDRRYKVKLNSALLLQGNEIGETNGLVSCHVCIIQAKRLDKKNVVISHFRVTDVHEHIHQIGSILSNFSSIDAESVADVLLFRLAPQKIVEQCASPRCAYHLGKYESATKLLKDRLSEFFRHACVREVPYHVREKNGDWIKADVKHGRWISSFGSGFVEKGKQESNAEVWTHRLYVSAQKSRVQRDSNHRI